MQKTDPSNYQDAFLKSKPVDDYLKFMGKSFWWKSGSYIVSFKIRSLSKTKFISHSFQFQLTQDNIDSMRHNLDEIKNVLHYAIKKPATPDLLAPTDSWIWLNPILKRINK